MGQKLYKQVKDATTSAQSFTPARTGLLQCKRAAVQPSSLSPQPFDVPSVVHEVMRSPGRLLDAATRAFMEPRFGHNFSQVPAHTNRSMPVPANLTTGAPHDEFEQEAEMMAQQVMSRPASSTGTRYDLSDVRIHTDGKAADSARAVNALAYTVGRDIVFGPSQFAPETHQGRRLLAHELSHVAQQAGNGGRVIQRQPDKQEEGHDKDKKAATFSGCGTAEQKKRITDASQEAKSMAGRAIAAFEREYPLTNEISAMKKHFGSSLTREQQATILERYRHIQVNVESKTYTCAPADKTSATNEHFDGEAPCPGKGITLFPLFFREKSPGGPVILHEAVHNAGACDDIKMGSGYPPGNAEENAYSYENFAVELLQGEKVPELHKRTPTAPK